MLIAEWVDGTVKTFRNIFDMPEALTESQKVIYKEDIKQLEIFIPLSGVIDIDKETERLNKQISNLNGRLNSVNSKLDNKNFVKNAPEEVVNHERNKQEKYQQEHVILTQNLESIVS